MMYIGISLIICSLIYSIVVFIIFFAKQRIKSPETDIYRILLVSNITNLILELGCFATISHVAIVPILATIVSKLLI